MVYQQDLKRLKCTSIYDYFNLIVREAEEGNLDISRELIEDLDTNQKPISQRRMFQMYLEISKINLDMFI
jgi:hypothetical protein